jgi:hypothetical protein
VPRRPAVPPGLTHGPFTVADARRAGLSRWHLEGATWRRLGPGVYAWAGLPESPTLKLQAATVRLPEWAAFSGRTAAWLHGLDVAPCEPIEVILRHIELDDPEVVVRRGFRTTTLLRTLFDLSRRLSLVEAVVVVDMALHARLISQEELRKWIDHQPGRKGVGAARRVLDLAEPAAESPMETRLRMLLVLNGLPRPRSRSQFEIKAADSSGARTCTTPITGWALSTTEVHIASPSSTTIAARTGS